jgi:uncharacterized protein
LLGQRVRREGRGYTRDDHRGSGEPRRDGTVHRRGIGRRGGRERDARCVGSGSGELGGRGSRGVHEDDEQGPLEGRQAGQEARRFRRVELRAGHVRERQQAEALLSTPPAATRIAGVGLGLRWEFLDELVDRSAGEKLPIDFLEIAPENYMRRGGRHPEALRALAGRFPLLSHGLTMSLGGVDPLDAQYLVELAAFLRDVRSPWHSDHLCFGAFGGRILHDLLPLAFKEATVARVADRIKRARDALRVPLAVENVSYYWHPGRAEMGEAEFLARVCDAADCGLMLDVNNAYVNASNFGFDAEAWMRTAPLERTVQIHVAGHEWFGADASGLTGRAEPRSEGAMIVDTHGADVPDPVLALLARVYPRTGPVPIVLERDQNIPDLDGLLAEMGRIRAALPLARAEQDAALAEVRQ